ncbi:MAG: hypothetical protein U5R31_03190 [Acidimicrobiia bacterium]|nr:hypothetical protein [Acidimicrobiia bacterium]
MSGIDELNRTIARFEAAAAELDAKIREAHAATKDARDARRALAELIDRTLPDKAATAVDQAVAPEVKKALDTVLDGMRSTEDRITKRFDKVAAILMGEDGKQRREGKPTIEQLARQATGSTTHRPEDGAR